jgi:hypothetical protein
MKKEKETERNRKKQLSTVVRTVEECIFPKRRENVYYICPPSYFFAPM